MSKIVDLIYIGGIVVGIGKKIVESRHSLDLTQKELAEKAGISTSYLKKIEEGHYIHPPIKVLALIANALNIEIRSLFS